MCNIGRLWKYYLYFIIYCTVYITYYADKLKFNLMSVPAMASYGVTLNVGNDNAFIRKGNATVPLVKRDGLWALPTDSVEFKIASLKQDTNKAVNAKVWHDRLAHASDQQIAKMIEQGVIPKDAKGFKLCK